MFKKLIIGLGVIVVALAVGMYYFASNANKIVANVIETQGSRVTKVAVALDGVDLSLTDLKAGLRGLTVGNPTGFQTDRAVSLGEVSVRLSKQWSPDLIVVEEVMVRAPEVTYEIGNAGSNIAAIQQNVKNFMSAIAPGPSGGASGGQSTPTSSGGDAGPKVVINNFYIQDGKVNVSASLMKGKTLTTALPDIHIKDIGKKSNGATPAEVIDQIIAAITKSSGNAASALDLSQLGLSDISGKAADIGKAATDAANQALQGAQQGAGTGATDAAKGAVEGATGALKGLLGQ